VHTKRITHATEDGPAAQPEPLVNLLAEDKLDCSQCIVDYRVKMWAKSLARAAAKRS
jgi:hypothetical protein